ncbi:hypothetical protein BJ875DRAFT_190141 [Amylocarpus encephaloides]|uniref:Proteophosphoglycan 5 n=1 Tax=Amylocarpus encephaloides TaxID=45428 RepID=A0A9P7YT92_9HELO|nr:hypothetical protein BJ875DRAFT_190141 [Amylocarpus encephaloides]
MSSEDIPSRSHRQTRSVAISPATPSSQNPHNPHNSNAQALTENTTSDMNYPAHPTTPPRTPRRNNQPQNATNSNTRENGSKQKTRNNKNRPKNVVTSPPVKGRDGRSPSFSGAQSSGGRPSSARPINTPKAYAGATFHASPAPSALPIPSFHSKSVPESPGMKGLQSVMESPLSKTDQPPTPPVFPTSVTNVVREESPLDLFFKADREEKARAQSASSANPSGKATEPFRPPPEYLHKAQTPPALSSQSRPGPLNRASSSSMFAMELDSSYSPGAPLGQAFSTPYSERINAAKSGSNHPREDPQDPLDRSEALKAYLFSGTTISPQAADTTTIGSSPLTPKSLHSPNGQSSPVSSSRPQNDPHLVLQGNRAQNSGGRNPGRSSRLRQEVTSMRTPTMTPNRNSHFDHSQTPSRIYGNVMHSNSSNLLASSTSHSASPSPALSYGVSSSNRNADLEDTLRKVLKLDSPRDSGASQAGMVGSTSAGVPNYID